jgi:hypothetical protein
MKNNILFVVGARASFSTARVIFDCAQSKRQGRFFITNYFLNNLLFYLLEHFVELCPS